MRRVVTPSGLRVAWLVVCAACGPSTTTAVGPERPTAPEEAAAAPAEAWLPEDVPAFAPAELPSRRYVDLEALRRRRWAEPVAGWVSLVPEGTLHATRGAALGDRSPVPPIPRVSDEGSRGLLLEVVADHGDVVEVKTPASSQGHCGRPKVPLPFHRVALRAFARKRDLRLVLTDVVEITFEDGTGAAVAPGVPVGQPEVPLHGEPAVSASGFTAELPIPLDEVGLGYEPDGLARPPHSDDWRLPEVTVSFRGRPWWRLREHGYVGFEEAGETEDGIVLHLGGACMSVWVLSPEPLAAVRRGGGGGIGMIGRGSGGMGSPEPETKIVQRSYTVKGAEVQWPDGSRAGEVRRRYRLHDGALAGTHCVALEGVKLDREICLPPDSYVVEDEEVRVWPKR